MPMKLLNSPVGALSGGSERAPMRILLSLVVFISIVLLSLAAKPPKSTAPKIGVKTPGVQIPFASLKAEAEIDAPAKPEWIFSSGSTFAPNKDGIDKIDPKTNKK